MIGAGFALQPDDEFLARTASIAQRADYLEVTPETTWIASSDGALAPNGFHARFLGAARAWRKPVVAHGVGLSMGTGAPEDEARRERWLTRMRADQRLFEYAWWTDHLGASSIAGEAATVSMPLPMTAHAASIVRARLDAMAEIVADVGVENSVVHFTIGHPLEEPAFLRDVLRASRRHLVLDLHNLHTMSVNLGFDPHAWLAACDLGRVIELHVSGGAESDPRWLPSGRSVRLDGHDGAVPEDVWALLDELLPRCPNARGVTLERMEGTVLDDATVALLHLELDRVQEAIARSETRCARALPREAR